MSWRRVNQDLQGTSEGFSKEESIMSIPKEDRETLFKRANDGLATASDLFLIIRGKNIKNTHISFFEVELINEAEEHYKKGLEFFLAGDIEDADKHLSKALDIDSRYAKAHLQMGVLRKMQGKKQEALKHFAECIALDPHSEAGKEAKVHKKRMTDAAPSA